MSLVVVRGLGSCSAIVHFVRNHCLYFICQRCTQVGVGVNPDFSLICYKNFMTFEKEINCFRLLFAC